MNPNEDGVLIITKPLDKEEAARYVLWALRRFYGNNPSIVN